MKNSVINHQYYVSFLCCYTCGAVIQTEVNKLITIKNFFACILQLPIKLQDGAKQLAPSFKEV